MRAADRGTGTQLRVVDGVGYGGRAGKGNSVALKNRGKIRITGALAALAMVSALLFGPPAAQGRIGSLDPSFGEGGKVTTPIRLTGASPRMAVAPDGSTVLASGLLIYRYLPDGNLDSTFGQAGTVQLPEKVEDLQLEPESITVDSQGRILVFGAAVDPGQIFNDTQLLLSASASWGIVMRLTADGRLDPTFGEGKGYFRSDLGLRSELETSLPLVLAAVGRVDSQDRPVFIAGALGLTGRCNYGHTSLIYYPRALVRLGVDGRLDPTFGGGGINLIGGAEGRSRLGLDGADQPVAAVGAQNCRQGGNQVFRFSAGGSPLAAFGTAGTRSYPGLYFSALAPDGSMFLRRGEWVLGESNTRLYKTEPGGNLAKSFGKNGVATITLPSGAEQMLEPVAVDAQGRLVLVGRLTRPKPHEGKRGHHKHSQKKHPKTRSFVFIGRLLPNGTLDRSLGKQGWIMTLFTRSKALRVVRAALDSQDRLVLAIDAGGATQPPGPKRYTLARYLLDG